MKYLQRFNESYRIENKVKDIVDRDHGDVIDIIKDRLLDLDDNGFSIHISCSNVVYTDGKPTRDIITVVIERTHKDSYVPNRFYVKEILDDVTSLISHIDSEYTLGVRICFDSKYHDIVKVIGKKHTEQLKDMSYNPINGIELKFFKRSK